MSLLAGLASLGEQKPPRVEQDEQSTAITNMGSKIAASATVPKKSSPGHLTSYSPIGQLPSTLEAGTDSTTLIRQRFRGNRHILMRARDGSLFALRAGESDERIPLPLPLHPTLSPGISAPGLGPFLRTRQVIVDGSEQVSESVNYYYGHKAEHWKRDVPVFEKVRYEDLYPGIDLLYSVDELCERFELFLEEGADPSVIEFAPEEFEVRKGVLRLKASGASVEQPPPILIQDSVKLPVAFEDTQLESVRIRPRGHDPTKPARIVIERYSQMSSRREGERQATPMSADGSRVVVDSRGFVHLISSAVTQGTFRGTGLWDPMIGYLQEFTPSGMAIVKIGDHGVPITTTYIGGALPPYSVTIDERDAIYVSAIEGVGLPLWKDPGGRKVPAEVPVLFKLNADSTLGMCQRILANGPLHIAAIDVTPQGRLLIAGSASPGALPFQGGYSNESPADPTGEDALLFCADPSNKGHVRVPCAARFGGTGRDRITAVRSAGDGRILVAGFTCSKDFPLSNRPRPAAGSAAHCLAFSARFRDQGASESLEASFLSPDEFSMPPEHTNVAMALSSSGAVVVAGTGEADSAADPQAGRSDVWVWSLDGALSKILASFRLHGSGRESLVGIETDRGGSVYVVGSTSSTDFPQRLSAFAGHADPESHLFAARLNPLLSDIVWSTYIAGFHPNDSRDFGMAVGPEGQIYVAARSNWVLRAPESAPLAVAISRIDGGIVEVRPCASCPAGPVIKTIDRERQGLMIRGTGFSSDARVLVDGVPARAQVQGPTTIRVSGERFPSAVVMTVLNPDSQGWSQLLGAEVETPAKDGNANAKASESSSLRMRPSRVLGGIALALLIALVMARSRSKGRSRP